MHVPRRSLARQEGVFGVQLAVAPIAWVARLVHIRAVAREIVAAVCRTSREEGRGSQPGVYLSHRRCTHPPPVSSAPPAPRHGRLLRARISSPTTRPCSSHLQRGRIEYTCYSTRASSSSSQGSVERRGQCHACREGRRAVPGVRATPAVRGGHGRDLVRGEDRVLEAAMDETW